MPRHFQANTWLVCLEPQYGHKYTTTMFNLFLFLDDYSDILVRDKGIM